MIKGVGIKSNVKEMSRMRLESQDLPTDCRGLVGGCSLLLFSRNPLSGFSSSDRLSLKAIRGTSLDRSAFPSFPEHGADSSSEA